MWTENVVLDYGCKRYMQYVDRTYAQTKFSIEQGLTHAHPVIQHFSLICYSDCFFLYSILCLCHPPPYILQGVYNFAAAPGFIPREIREECNSTNISLLYAHECLYYAYGRKPWIKYIWAIGLLAAGQSSTMTVSREVGGCM